MNPRTRFRETLQPLLEALTILPISATFSATGPHLDNEFIHLDIAEDGSELKSRLTETGWRTESADARVATYRLADRAVELILRTEVQK